MSRAGNNDSGKGTQERRYTVPRALMSVTLAAGLAFPPTGIAFADVQRAQDDANGSGAKQQDGEAAPVAQNRALSFALGQATVPYGVDIDAWLSRDDVRLFSDGTQALNASQVAAYFAAGARPLTFAGSSYPAPGATVGVAVGAPAAGASVPNATDAHLTMAQTGDDGSLLPACPASLASLLRVSDAQGADSWRLAGTDATVLWLNAQATAGAVSVTTADPAAGAFQIAPDFALDATGAFTSDQAGATVAAGSAPALYLKLPTDMTATVAGQQVSYCEGQLLRLPVKSDTTAPTIADLTVTDATGNALDLSAAEDGTLALPSAGVKVTARVADPEPADPTLTDAERADATSGIDEGSVRLTAQVGGRTVEIAPDSLTADGLATFTLSLAALTSGGTYALDSLAVTASDVAGNAVTTPLSQAAPFAGSAVTALDIAQRIALAPGTHTVPYGVDVNTWLAAAPLLIDEEGATASAGDLSAAFAAGELPLSYAGSGYPTPGAALACAWGAQTPAGAADTPLPSLDALDVRMAPTDEAGVAGAALPVASADELRSLVYDADGQAGWRVSEADGAPVVWLSADDVAAGTVTLKAGAAASALSSSYEVAADGSFASPIDALALTSDAQVYAKRTGTDALTAGEVMRIPAAVDDAAPTVADLTATWASGEAITEDNSWVEDGSLYVPPAGLTVTARIADAGSGLDASSLHLSLGTGADAAQIAPDSFADGIATFTLTKDVLGGLGTYRLDDLAISVQDVAHNRTSVSLAQAPSFQSLGVNALEVVNEAAQAKRPEVALDVVDAQGTSLTPAADGTYYTNAAAGAQLRFKMSDARCQGLLSKQRWLSSNPVYYRDKGTYAQTTPIDPRSFSAIQAAGWYQSSQVGLLPFEGTYDLTYHYTGANLFLWWNLEAETTAKVVVDRTAPVVDGLSLAGGYDEATELARPAGSSAGSYVLIGGDRTLSVNVADLSAAASDGTSLNAASGVASADIDIVRHDALDGSDAGQTRTILASERDLASGTLSFDLSDAGVYRTSDVRVTVTDKAGNTTALTLAQLIAALPENERAAWGFDMIVVDRSQPSSGVAVTSAVDAKNAVGEVVHGNDAQAVLWIADEPWASLYARTDAFAQGIETSYAPAGTDVEGASVDVDALSYNDDAGRWEIPVTLSHAPGAAVPADGEHTVRFAYRTQDANPADNEATFVVDSLAPQMTDAEIEGDQDPTYDVAVVEGKKILVGGERTVRVRVQDLLPGSDGSGAGRDERYTSGVAEQKVRATLVRADGLSSDAALTTTTADVAVDAEGYATIDLADEGLYTLSDLELELSDYAGMTRTVRLSDALSSFDAILVDRGTAERSLTAHLVDAEGTPASKDPSGYYHRGSVDLAVEIRDPWFAAYQSIEARQADFFSLSCTSVTGEAIDPSELPAFAASDFTYDADLGAWTATYELRRMSGSDTRPIEGSYTLALRYDGISGATDATRADESFGIDYTPPAFGHLALSSTSPVSWGWIFPHDSETVSLGVSDNFSGVAADTAYFHRQGEDTPQPIYQDGMLSATFTEDADRMVFAETSAGVEDVAGNAGVLPLFAAWANANLPAGSIGFSVDTAAPTISVSYDNTDVRNGRYYAANRTATVTIEEANFDLLRANDERRTIATATCDGSSVDLLAKDFENPSGDGVTWVATYAFDRDGDWTFDAWLTDPAGREATPFHDEFTIDTTAPLLLVTFDNNEAANGMYYKATRTATIDVTERNFSADLTPISTTAADGNAPGLRDGATAMPTLTPPRCTSATRRTTRSRSPAPTWPATWPRSSRSPSSSSI